MKKIIYAICLMLIYSTVPAIATESRDKCEAIELASSAEEYNNLVCVGIESMNEGQYEEAIRSFNEALRIPLHEMPNFTLYPRLALAYFLNGDKGKAQENIEKAELSLAILFKLIECVETESGFELRSRNVKLSRSPHYLEMARKMCGAAYDYIYGNKTLANILQDAEYIKNFLDIKEAMQKSVH